MSEEVKIEAAESLLGKLQRGRGVGFLSACQGAPEKIWPLLIECITHDPRLDKQVESRDDFYAALIIETRMELKTLATYLHEHDDTDQFGWNTTLTVGTLGSLAKRNYPDAVKILRDYVAWGNWWNWAIDDLVATQNLEAWTNLDEIFCERFSSDDSIKNELAWFDANEDPLKTWIKKNVKLCSFANVFRLPTKKLPAQDYNSLTVADIVRLAGKDARVRSNLRKAIVNLVAPGDFEFLLSQISVAEPDRSGVALAGLAKLANPIMFDWLREFWSNNPEMPGLLRARAVEVMVAMPPSQTLPLACDWLNHDEWHFRHLAEELMVCHATLEDVPRLRQEITTALADDDNQAHRLCHLVEAFKHLFGIGRIPELESVFVEFRYSYGRRIAAEALWAVDRDFFVRTYAQECLWDCEDCTRALGCETADSATTETRGRLKQLSEDKWEDESVRNAATKRL